MAEETYEPWKPLADLPHKLWLEGLHDDHEGFRLLLRGADPTRPMLRLAFDSILGYRSMNESHRIRTWANVPKLNQLPTLLRVIRSGWIDWLVDESCGVLKPSELTHYAIYTPEDCVDVVTDAVPEVNWLR